MNSQIIKTNIPRLDEFLNGGIRPCTITTLWAAPGIDNAPFAYQALVNRLEDGDSCIYVNQSKASSTIEKEIEHYGWDVKPYIEDGRFIFLDAYSGLVNMKSTDKFVVENPRNVKSITESLKKILDEKKTKHAVVVYDSISTLIDHCGEKSLDE
ncbi:MAG: hypothetical protein DRO90_01860, partial [Candidatus Altiarchaeales archaeon]